MLFDEPVLLFKGLTIFRDFANPDQYYFLPPEAPRVARSAEESSDYALRLVLYRPDPNAPPPVGMENGAGFLNLDVDLHVDQKLLDQAADEVRKRFGGAGNLVPVPFLRGSVELILLGVGREDEGKPFVRKLAGSTTPSLYGAERAAFSVVLDRDGAALMRQVIEKGGVTMALAIYHLTYAAIPPAYNLKITVDYEKVYERLDLRLNAGVTAASGKSSFVAKAGFHMLIEDLKESKAVTVVEVDPVPGENGRTPVDQTKINEIIGNLMGSTWFKPTLASAAQMTDLGAGGSGSGGSGGSGGGTASPPSSPPSGGTTSPPSSPPSSPPAAQRSNAQWVVDSTTPATLPAGRGLANFQASQSGVKETLGVQGAGATAKSGADANNLRPMDITNSQLQVDVAEGATVYVEIKWATVPAGAGTRQAATWTSAPAGDAQRGVETFTPSPSGDDERLTIRGTGATAQFGPTADSLGAAATPPGGILTVPVPAGQTRAVRITWPAAGSTPALIINGQLTRAAATGATAEQPESTIKGHFSRGAAAAPTAPDGKGAGDKKDATTVQASFEVNLEMIQRTERVTATYELSTRKAHTQEVHPQGQLILDVVDPAKYIIEADGAIDFFQWLNIAASTTAQWDQEGIDAIQIQIRYAPSNGGYRRTGEVVLTKGQPTGAWKSGVLRAIEGDDRSPVLYSYDHRVTVHYLPDVAMGDQSGAVTSVGAKGADPDGWIPTTERNLMIHPRDVTPVVMVNIMTGVMRFDLLQRVQLALTYGPYRQNLMLSQDHPEHHLVIRPEAGLKDAPLHTEGMLFYKDGAQVPLQPQDWDPRELIVINEARENILRVQVILADPGHEYTRVSVRLRYEHGNRIVEEVRELITHAQMEEWAVRLEDPAYREWKYMATLIKKSGDIDTVDWTDGKSNQLILGVRAVDVIPVQVTWLIPPSGDTLAVKIDLRYVDEPNGVLWTHSELIRGTHPGDFTWSIAIADAKKRSYEYRVTEYKRSGAQEGSWTESSETMLVLPD